ncbi:MAG: hypothetical protein HY982_03080, partial [Candidatus Magasanikbacteria bacterium]|nr:hypothetical protein [Candidatus Magasanikbacteria bacterium]
KVTAADTGGLESAMSSASNAATPTGGSVSTGGSAGVITQPSPVLGAMPVAVSGNAQALTSLDIVLKFNVTNAVQMAISEKSDFSDASWESYVATKNYKLSGGLGTKKLYVKFITALGGASEVKTLDLNVISIAPEPTPAPAPTVITPETVPLTPITTTAGAPAPSIGLQPESKVVFSGLAAASYQPNTQLKFIYKYQNATEKLAKLKIVRQLVNSKGKIVQSSTVSKSLKPLASFQNTVKDTVSKKLPAGEYTVKIKILDAKTNKLLDENNFKIEIEKLKVKKFSLGEITAYSSDIAFDEKSLSKIKSDVKLPINLKLKYSYTNSTGEKQTVKMMRYLKDENGKILSAKSGKWVMKPGEKDVLGFTQPVAGNLSTGNYIIQIAALDWKTKEILAENGLGFRVGLK